MTATQPRSFMDSTPSSPEGTPVAPSGGGNPTRISAAITFGYTRHCAVVVVEGATVRPFVTETSTMLVIGLVLSVAGIGFFCWLLFALVVYALPFFAGLTAGLAAFHGGSGVIGALVVGVLAGSATLAIGQIGFATVRTPLIRAAIALLFAVPAACRRLPRDVWARPFRHTVNSLARGLRDCRRCPCRRHGLGANVAACPAVFRSAGRRRSGIVSIGGRDPGRVRLRRPHRRRG
jgi:hypothetical protein